MSTGTVRFVSLDGSLRATGKIQSDGTYTLGRQAPGDGLEPGEYAVTVEVRRVESTSSTNQNKYMLDTGVSSKVEWLVPEKYANKQTSGIQKTVEKGSNTINLDLE